MPQRVSIFPRREKGKEEDVPQESEADVDKKISTASSDGVNTDGWNWSSYQLPNR